jgi:hypothetical protein
MYRKIRNVRDWYRGVSDFKKGYQPRTNIVRDEKGDVVTDCHSTLVRWRNHFSQLLIVHGVSDVRQTEIHTAEPLVPEPSAFDFEIAIEKIKIRKSPGIDQILAELLRAVGRTVRCEIYKLLILFAIRRNCLRSGRNPSLYLSIRRAMKQIVVIIEAHHFCQLRTKLYSTS